MSKVDISPINDVIDQLTEIIEECKTDNSPLGYFAALYRQVTIKVRDEIGKNYFDDDECMVKLDAVFAQRYLDAYHTYKSNEPTTLSWKKSFEIAGQYWYIVLQHLLMGMNAHINLDLGIAAAQVCTVDNFKDLEGDFNKINELLAGLVGNVEEDLSNIWRFLKVLLKIASGIDTLLANFSMELARKGAWKFAGELIEVRKKLEGKSDKIIEDAINQAIKERDLKIADFSKVITHPGFVISTIFVLIRLGERGTVLDKIRALS